MKEKKQRSLADIGSCPNCHQIFIEDWRHTEQGDWKWDGYTYRANCDCMNPNLRFSIG